MFNDDNTTVIKIRWLTRSELKRLALNGETYDEVIKRLIDHYVKSQTDSAQEGGARTPIATSHPHKVQSKLRVYTWLFGRR